MQHTTGRSVAESLGELVAVVVPPLRLFAFARELGNSECHCSSPFVGEVEIDQAFGRAEGVKSREDASPTERGDHHEEPTLVCTSDVSNAVFTLHGLGIDIERIVFDDLLCFFGRNPVGGDVVAVASIPVKTTSESNAYYSHVVLAM